MWHFLAGFVVGLCAGGAALLFVRRRSAGAGIRPEAPARELEELAKLTGELAHEIRNPLSTLKVNLQLVMEDLAAVENARESANIRRATRKVEIIRKETDRLEQILDGFLKYVARPELEPMTVDLNELVGDMIDFYGPQAVGHGIAVKPDLCEGKLMCRLDPDMLKQVLLNLFINAQQAMSGGGDLTIRTDRARSEAVIEVIDTGAGIPPDRIGRIFDAYYSTRPEGSGLGLSTARKIIGAHGGRIDVQSEPGKGAAFTIRLPRRIP